MKILNENISRNIINKLNEGNLSKGIFMNLKEASSDSNSITLTDIMLSKIPLPKGEIVFDEEVELSSFKNVYGDTVTPVNGKVRVIISNFIGPMGTDWNQWEVNGYYIDEKEGFCGYTSRIDKENCKTVKDVLDKIVRRGEFSKYGANGKFGKNFEYVSGVWYPNESNTVKNPLIKSAKVLNFGYRYMDTLVYGELTDGKWFIGYVEYNLEDEPYVDMLNVYDVAVPQRIIDVLVGKNRRRDSMDFNNKFVKEHGVSYPGTKKLGKEIIFRLDEFKANNSSTVFNKMNHNYD